jgi:hypothetical protein
MSEVEKKNGSVSITAEDLKEIIATAIAAAKAPNAIEQAQLDRSKAKAEQDNQTRLETAAQVKQEMQNQAFHKQTCQHEGGKPKHPHTVFVSDEIGGYVLCQACRAVIRPENQLVHFPKDIQQKRLDIIFNTALFNRVFQATDAQGVFA